MTERKRLPSRLSTVGSWRFAPWLGVPRPCRRSAVLIAALSLLGFACPALAAADLTTKVVVERADAATRDLLAARAALVADRGQYRVFALDPAVAAAVAGNGGVTLRADFDSILLRRHIIDTRDAATASSRALVAATSARHLKLVQFNAPPTDADLLRLAESGARIVQYVPQNAYLVWTGSDSGARALRRLNGSSSGIQFYGDFEPDDALAPALDGVSSTQATVAVTVQLFNHGAAVWGDVSKVKALADSVLADAVEAVGGTYINMRLAVRGDRLRAITKVDAVINVEPFVEPKLFCERQGQIVAGNLTASLQNPSGPGYLAWLAARGFSATAADYPVVAVVDDGVDNGTTSPLNNEFRELNGPAAPSRILFAVAPPGSATTSTDGPDGHGNINASIVGGYNASTGAAVEDGFGFNYGLGISPYGRLSNVRVFAPNFDIGSGNATMVSDYYGRGARLSSNSWGADVAGAYDSFAQEYDALTRDAEIANAGNQQILFIFAAGNAGPSGATVGSPGTAKNVLTVGASETSNPDAAAGDGCGDTVANGDDARDMASFSSRGPCSDGRVKPDIVAPGTFIQGAASQPAFNGSGVCGAAGNNFKAPGTDALFPAGSAYTWSSGTSHSTPATAGVCSLVHEFLPRVYGVGSPSPALTKAYVLHSARHLSGAGANENLPGNNQGFGLVDMGLGFSTAATRFFQDQTTVFHTSGESVTFSGAVSNPSEPIRVALVWTDAPGSTIGNAYVNDLNLSVDVGGSTYLGNNFTLGISHSGGSADTRDNAEAVSLPAGASGTMSITVSALTIAGDGVPGNGDSTDQDFALVAYNFTTVVSAGTITFHQDVYSCSDSATITVADADLQGLGTLNVGVTSSGGDAETVTLSETSASSGTFVGSIAMTAAVAVVGNGSLEVAHGETLSATYNDADNGTGNPATVQDSAAIDCVAPITSNVATINIAGARAEVTLITDETATVHVRYGTSCGSLTQTQAGDSAGTTHQVNLTGLSPLTPYFFVVDATDTAGNMITDDNGGSCYSFTTLDRGDYFTELFDAADNDLDNQTLTLRPDGSPDFYAACRMAAVAFPTDPSGGTVLSLSDDSFLEVTLSGGKQVSLYGTSYSSFFVGSNGYVTFGSADTRVTESLAVHFSLPRIAGLFDDLDPGAGGSVTWKQLPDRAVVTFENVPEYGAVTANSFQIEMFFDGIIRITHLGIAASDGLAGVSEGLGLPGDFRESDLNAYGPCSAGTMALDREAYGCADAVRIGVIDGDLSATGTLNVGVTSSGGDAEIVTLTETPASSGIFVGSIATAAASVVNGNGSLDVAHGQTITATYNDANDGTGIPATVQDAAAIDCMAPVISNVATIDIGSTQAAVTLSTDETASARVRYGSSCDSLTQTQAGDGAGTAHQIHLAGLSPSTQYFFAVDASDDAGNTTTDDNGGSCYSFASADKVDYFTESFAANDNDLDNQTLTLTPDGSARFYSACRTGAAAFPTDPSGGTVLSLSDDSFAEVSLSGGMQVSFYGSSYSSFFVGSNGYVTFGSGDIDLGGSLTTHFALPRIAALLDDLDPGSGGSVSWRQLADRVVVTFQDVPEYGRANANSFQIEMFFDGTIRITHLRLAATGGLAGLSQGLGLPADFQESDLNTYAACSVGCPSVPETGCFTSDKSSVSFKRDGTNSGRNRFAWKWSKGTATLTQASFGDPLNGTTSYRLCVYDQSAGLPGLKMGAVIDPGGSCPTKPCWRTVSDKGWKYTSRDGNAYGINKVGMKGGAAGKPFLQLAGKAGNLPVPAPIAAIRYLDQDTQVIVQLHSSNPANCWESSFGIGNTKINDGSSFKAATP